MEKKVFKFFTVDNMEKEAAYLNEMAQKGWFFKAYKSFRYHFEQGEPAIYSYAIDFKANEGDEEAYKTLFADAGWENVYCYPVLNGNWMYFRKAIEPGKTNEAIFTDKDSLIQLYKRIRTRWTIFGVIMSLFLLFELLLVFPMDNYFGVTTFIFIMFIILVSLYGKMFFNLTRKINNLVARKS
ncbi:DUF2812 domain-containing protein [Listeria farberi]|uniref:DUF2812 domain-containing protein n=1 Tax=Listeria farberi TaxID=2713500 RepID=A0A7X0ZFZ7_9LIST|nr:DUF2812 domain-containing protein [Listeria farberi]MBC1374497.1 DUF2812 domain-containing protein [Listeria farberi]MBC1380915.1 DUF2812 domain-containing protein [Listeria farberi]MBC2286612.1 DUF2812 domain-containing protein [Listeria farberi]